MEINTSQELQDNTTSNHRTYPSRDSLREESQIQPARPEEGSSQDQARRGGGQEKGQGSLGDHEETQGQAIHSQTSQYCDRGQSITKAEIHQEDSTTSQI